MASKKSQKMRIILKAYDHQLIDFAASKLIDTVKKTGAKVSGPVPLPTKKEVVTILRAVHKYKDSREQFEQRTHKRLIDVLTPSHVDTCFYRPFSQYLSFKIQSSQKVNTLNLLTWR